MGYRWDVRLMYGGVFSKLERTIAEMEQLKQEYSVEQTKMEAKSTDKKTFQLTENKQLLGELNILIVLLGIYTANYIIASMSGAISGMG